MNDDPTASDDAFTVTEDTANNSLTVLTNESDPIEGDTLSVASVGATNNGGTAVANGTTIRYTPAPKFFGAEVFTYTVSDGHGGSASATVTVTVNNVNDAPDAKNDGYTVMQNGTAVFSPLTNDLDADHDTLTVTTLVHQTTAVRPLPTAPPSTTRPPPRLPRCGNLHLHHQ